MPIDEEEMRAVWADAFNKLHRGAIAGVAQRYPGTGGASRSRPLDAGCFRVGGGVSKWMAACFAGPVIFREDRSLSVAGAA